MLIAPAGLWYLVLLVAPLAIVFVFSFGVRASNGGYAPAFTFDNYVRLLTQPERLEPFITSLWMAVAGTIGCLLVGLPLAYFMATRAGRRKGLLVLLLVIPFWTSFLIRTYSWLIVLGKENLGGFIGSLIGDPSSGSSARPFAVLVGLVYGYLPLMVFPLYVTLERMDRTLVEASKDLGAARWATFRQITLPIALPGLITGSILVFIPMMGEYVIPAILGLRPDVPRRQRARGRVHPDAQLAVRVGDGRGPDRDHAGHGVALRVVREPRPVGPRRERPVRHVR